MKLSIQSASKENTHDKLCKCDISLSKMGGEALHSHATGKKHKKWYIGVLLFGAFLTTSGGISGVLLRQEVWW